MKKQALSLFLAGALALSLFGCSAQPAAESAPQSSPAETAGSSSAGVVEELHLGTTAANDTFTTFVESGAFGKMCYNSLRDSALLADGAQRRGRAIPCYRLDGQ